jgi:hypothetical protein
MATLLAPMGARTVLLWDEEQGRPAWRRVRLAGAAAQAKSILLWKVRESGKS